MVGLGFLDDFFFGMSASLSSNFLSASAQVFEMDNLLRARPVFSPGVYLTVGHFVSSAFVDAAVFEIV